MIPTKRVELGTIDLKKGNTRLKMEVIAKNAKSIGLMAGLNCVVLEPAR